MTLEEITKLQAENDRLKAENQFYKTGERQARKEQNAQYLDSLMSKGKLAPIAKEKAESLLNYASDYDNGETLDFSEGESLTQQVRDFLEAQPQTITFGEIATKEKAFSAESKEDVQYAKNTDPVRIELDQQIRRYMVQHNISYQKAFLAIHQGAK